jgi:hypothetical protein
LTVSLFNREHVSIQTIATFFEHDEPEVKKPAGTLLATDIKVTGQPLDPTHIGRIIKPRELVDIIELTPLNRSETILYNQLLAHAWNNIKTQPVHKVLKASLRGTHDSNDRLHEAFDRLMSASAKIRARDPQTGEMGRSASTCSAPTRSRTRTTGISTTPSRLTFWPSSAKARRGRPSSRTSCMPCAPSTRSGSTR